MRKMVDSKCPCDAMIFHSTEGMFFCTLSSKKAIAISSLYDYEQSSSSDFVNFTFTGKEKDEETGYGYFGARYMDHELMTSWLSVDPMADKYPSISPYAYCAWNPVKLVDPDGMEWDPASVDRIAEFRATTEQKKKDALTESEKNEFQKVLDELDALGRSNQVYHLEIGGTENSKRPGGTSYNLAKKWVSLNYDGTDKCLAHELKHAYQFEKGELSFSSKTGSLADVVT